MLYVKRKFKSVTMDLTQYIHILFMLNLIFESLLVPGIVPENIPSRYPTQIKYVDIKQTLTKKKAITRTCFHYFIPLSKYINCSLHLIFIARFN